MVKNDVYPGGACITTKLAFNRKVVKSNVGYLEITIYWAGGEMERAVEPLQRVCGKLSIGKSAFELEADAEVFGSYCSVLEAVERDMGIAAVGGEDNGTENVTFILNRENAR